MTKQSNKMKEKIKCPKCKSKEIIKWGKRKTNNRGKIQRYKCKKCNDTFINDPFARMRNSPQKITCALDLFFRGLSTREVQNHFKCFFPHNSDHSTILRWIRKFSLKISNYTDNLKLKTGSYIEVDEMEYHRRKSHKKKLGADKNWFIDSIDVKSRFMISSSYVKSRNQKELKSVLTNIKNKTGEQVKIVTTDGLTQYPRVVKSVYGYYNLKKGLVNHKVVNASKGEGFNIWVERMHNSIRQRTQNFRGFHGSVESANAIMKGLEIYYNFIRRHQSLNGKTPSEIATDIKLTNPNKWLELIEMANKN